MYLIEEVDGEAYSNEINYFNSLAPDIFPPLTLHHLTNGHWWFAYSEETGKPVAFAGLVPFEVGNVAYFKRCLVLPEHRGRGGGLQLRLMTVREVKARELGYAQIVSECRPDSHSNANFRRAFFETFEPEQPWGKYPDDVYWRKTLV